VWEFFEEGSYPEHGAVKEEVEAHVAALIGTYDASSLAASLDRHDFYLREWVPERLDAAQAEDELARLVAFADLQYRVEDDRAGLMLKTLNLPKPNDFVFEQLPSIYEHLTRDGLFRITPENIPTEWFGAEAVFAAGEDALFPHPRLAQKRELVGLLMELAEQDDLRVSVALHPFRQGKLADVRPRLLEDYWSGIKTTQANLDSLDAHNVGNPAFHAAGQRSPVQELFYPLLGTWFDWTRRGDDHTDPVKRLYVREIRPPEDGHGNQLIAVYNNELHTERDTQRHRFTHIDGKVRRYPAETYGPSRHDPRADCGPPSHSRKLWRVDGSLTDEQWSDLIGLHFRGNDLIGEHFAKTFPATAQ